MAGNGSRHCPFLNRDDPRCAAHLGVNRLARAFEHCAGAFEQCPTYRLMLDERQRMRGETVEGTLRYNGRLVARLPATVTLTPLTHRGRHVTAERRHPSQSTAAAAAHALEHGSRTTPLGAA